MLRPIFLHDIPTIRHYIQRHSQGAGPRVVARIAGWPGTFQVYDVREGASSAPPEEQPWCHDLLLPSLPTLPKKVEVQIRARGDRDWHVAQTLFLEEVEEGGA